MNRGGISRKRLKWPIVKTHSLENSSGCKMSQRHAHHVAATGHKDLARAFNFRALTSEERALARQDQSATINDVPESVEIAATGSRLSIHITAINSAQNQHTGHLVSPKPIEPIYCDVNWKLGSLQRSSPLSPAGEGR
jgi:hypothetical protein